MVEYLKTKKGFFYKLSKNGKKKRISQKEYNKKNKTRKNKKMIGGTGEPIEESDIMYQDDLVCILKPDVKKGIIVFSMYDQPREMESLCNLGLKIGKQLHEEGINFGRKIYHPYIFFRAPYYSREIDYSTVETEIISSYGTELIGKKNRVFIRVDPDRTFVFSSEIRAVHNGYNDLINDFINYSKKTLTQYLKIINKNLEFIKNGPKNTEPIYNLFSSEVVELRPRLRPRHEDFFDNFDNEERFPSKRRYSETEDFFDNFDNKERFPLNNIPIQRSSEILVSIPHLTPDYFVLCT